MDVIMLCNKLIGKPVLAMGLRFGIIEVLNLLVTNFGMVCSTFVIHHLETAS